MPASASQRKHESIATYLLSCRQSTINKGYVVDEAARKQRICLIKHLRRMSRPTLPCTASFERTISRKCSACNEPS